MNYAKKKSWILILSGALAKNFKNNGCSYKCK